MGDTTTDLTCTDLQQLVQRRWDEGAIKTTADLSQMPRKEDYAHIPWTKVDCMQTKLIGSTEDGVGYGLDLFAPQSEEKSVMHRHPRGDRIATVLEGGGVFFALKPDGELIQEPLVPGDVVVFPRGIPHAFWGTEEEALLLHVVLNPFVGFDEPDHTIESPRGAAALEARGLI